MTAAPIHFERLPWERTQRLLRAMGRVLIDSEKTNEIIVAEEIAAQAQLRYWVENGVFERGEGPDLLRDRPEIAHLDLDTLRALPGGSLGREFARFLDDHGIGLEGLDEPTPYTEGETETYLLRRIRQCHDLWHLLLGVGTQGHEEILVHCFSVAQTGFPYSLAVISMGSVKHMLLEGRWKALTRDTRRAYRSGREARPLLTAYWERRWEQPLDDVRREFGIVPVA